MLTLCRNAVAIQVAIVAALFAWIYGGIRPDALQPVIPWVWVMLAELMLCFPQAHQGESTFHARERVWRALKADPVTWIVISFVFLLCIPLLNTGLCENCDAALVAAGHDPDPPIPFLPYCVNRMEHYETLTWFVPALTCMLAVRHSLLKSGKRLVLQLLVWNGVALAILGAVQQLTDAAGPLWAVIPNLRKTDFFSTFGYANMGGDYFTTLFGISVGLWRWRVEEVRRRESADDSGSLIPLAKRFWIRHYPLIASVILFGAALSTLSRAAILLSALIAVIMFVHTSIVFLCRMRRDSRVKAIAVCAVILFAIVLAAIKFLPKELQREADRIGMRETLNRVSGKTARGTTLGFAVWRDNILFGCGGNGYRHFCVAKMSDDERDLLKYDWGANGLANIHNDCLQFMAEHGAVGFGCLVAITVFLVLPLASGWRAMYRAVRFAPPPGLPQPRAVFVLPAGAFAIALTALATLGHSMGDCPLRSPAVLSLFFISLAAVEGFLPKTIKE